jgi:KDEL-tailed cysteine endopeptidase
MRCQAVLLFVLLTATCCLAADHLLRQQHEQELLRAKANPKAAFAEWMLRHGKGYANDAKETEQRFAAWEDNLRYIEEYNTKAKSHWLGLNGLADLTHEEYKQKYALGMRKFVKKSNRLTGFSHGSVDADNLPAEIDWRKTAVAEVKNQQQCGSCWAFSTTGAIEGINAIVTGEVVSLSEQELVDCDTKMDHGCSGGLMDYAFEYVQKKGGLHTEKDYPYTASDGVCQRDDLTVAGGHRMVTIDGYEDVPPYNELALKKAVSKQPVAVAIEADQRSFQLYMGGVYDEEDCGEQLDHGVLAVGYGVQSSDEAGEGVDAAHRNYWIIKNSWGGQWGDKGYIRIRMGRGKAGLCGIAMQPSYPLKSNPNPPTPPPGPKPGPKPPSPPKPEPVQCDSYSECPPSTTCCCLSDIAGFCFSWGCCPMEGATCCPDKQHCCPSDLPVCDTDEGRCLPKQGSGYARSAPWATKVPATRKDSAAAISSFFRPSSSKGQQKQNIKVAVA